VLGKELRRVLRGPAPPLITFGRQPELVEAALGLRAVGWALRDEFVWVKGQKVLWTGGKKPRHAHEDVWWFVPAGAPPRAIHFDAAAVYPKRREGLTVLRKRPMNTSQASKSWKRLAAGRSAKAYDLDARWRVALEEACRGPH
jgi:hypothetical protein